MLICVSLLEQTMCFIFRLHLPLLLYFSQTKGRENREQFQAIQYTVRGMLRGAIWTYCLLLFQAFSPFNCVTR